MISKTTFAGPGSFASGPVAFGAAVWANQLSVKSFQGNKPSPPSRILRGENPADLQVRPLI
jgi:hypothetical protein